MAGRVLEDTSREAGDTRQNSPCVWHPGLSKPSREALEACPRSIGGRILSQL